MAVAARPARREVPELAGLIGLILGQLQADAIAVLDQRHAPEELVACGGPAAEELVSQLDALPCLMQAFDEDDIVHSATTHGAVVSVPVAVEPTDPLGTMHILHRGPGTAPAPRPTVERALVAARQIALVLAQATATPGPVERLATREWLVDLNLLPSTPEAIPRMTTMVVRGLRRALGATAACISVWDEERSVLRALPGAFGSSDRALGASISGPPTNAQSLASRVFVTGRPYMTNHASGDPALLQHYVDIFRLERVLAVPLTVGTHPIGVLILVNKPTPFTIHDVTELEAFAPQIAVSVKLALAMEKIRRSQRMDRVLAATATDIAAGAGLADCFATALAELGSVTDASLALLTPRGQPPIVWRGRRVEAELARRFRDDAVEMARRAVGAYPHDAGDPGWAAVHAPVMFSGERVAAVSLLRQTGMPFGADETETVSRLANLAALAWAGERYQRQIAELALSRERSRIADELHDHVAQILFAAQIGVDSLLESEPGEEAGGRLIDIRGLLTRGEAAIREVIDDCHEPGSDALVRRLERVVESVRREFNVFVHVELPVESSVGEPPRAVADCAVKVAHEAIVNAAKHAGPCRITLSLDAEDGEPLRLSVLDDGLGRPHETPFTSRHGLDSMTRAVQDAGGTLRLAPGRRGRGTRVTATFPV